MTINYGWFANISSIATLENSISGSSISGNGASLKVTAKRGPYSSARYFGNGPSAYLDIDMDGSSVTVKRSTSEVTRANSFGTDDGKPHSFEVISGNNPSGGAPAYHFFIDGNDRGWEDAVGGNNSFWTINALLSAASAGKEGAISRATVKAGISVIADWDGNYVLNAAGDDFILRTAAENDPSLAESGYQLKMYDTTSVSGNHINLPSGTTWEFASATSLPDSVLSGQTYSFSTPPSFQLSRLQFGSYEIPFTFDAATNSGTFTAPKLGTSSPFNKFGSITITLYDDVNSVQSSGDTEWAPSPPYIYLTLNGSPNTSNMSNAYYQWQDPPARGDQAVYDPTNYTISQRQDDNDPAGDYFGRLAIKPDAPASFAVNEYVIDDNGIQEFERNSSSAVVIGETPQMTLNGPSTVTMTEGDSYTDQGANWTDAEDGSGTVYSSLIINESTAAGTYTQPYSHTDTDGNTVTRSRTIVVEPAQVSISSTINVSITGIPDGPHEVVLHKRGTREVIHDGLLTFSNETASLSIDGVAANEEVYGVWFGDNPPETGTGTYGVTE